MKMILFKSLACLAVLALVAADCGNCGPNCNCLKEYQQCGGRDNCPYPGGCLDMPWRNCQCPTGTLCIRKDQFYWQCLSPRPPSPPSPPKSPSPPPRPPRPPRPPPTPFPPSDVCWNKWAQCGGTSACPYPSGSGLCGDKFWGRCCPSGQSCVRVTGAYWQCLPPPGPPRPPSPPKPPSPPPKPPSPPPPPCPPRNNAPLPPFPPPIGPDGCLFKKQFEQCGGTSGKYYNVCCESGNTCKQVNSYYWQCLP